MSFFVSSHAQGKATRLRTTAAVLFQFLQSGLPPNPFKQAMKPEDRVAEIERRRRAARSAYVAPKPHGRSEAAYRHLRDLTTEALMAEVDR